MSGFQGTVGEWLASLAKMPGGAAAYALDAFPGDSLAVLHEMKRRGWIGVETCAHQHTVWITDKGMGHVSAQKREGKAP